MTTFWQEARKWFLPHLWMQDEPTAHAPLKYEPEFGFEDRQPRVNKASWEEMESVNLEREYRTECAHLHIAYRSCVKSNAPLLWRCTGYSNEIKSCYYESRIHEMKEFERERRLNRRERLLREQAAKESA